ncbi:unnamed protein product [Lampetra planeri]
MSDGNLMMYETQHFGFTPQSCLDGMYNAVQEYIYSVLKAVEDCVLENVARGGSQSSSVEKVRQGTQLLIDHMKETERFCSVCEENPESAWGREDLACLRA